MSPSERTRDPNYCYMKLLSSLTMTIKISNKEEIVWPFKANCVVALHNLNYSCFTCNTIWFWWLCYQLQLDIDKITKYETWLTFFYVNNIQYQNNSSSNCRDLEH